MLVYSRVSGAEMPPPSPALGNRPYIEPFRVVRAVLKYSGLYRNCAGLTTCPLLILATPTRTGRREI